MRSVKVFLGGTCNNSLWRNELISKLRVEYYNPVVPDWTEEQQKIELEERRLCDYCLYVITPLMVGVYSIAEVIDDSNKRPSKTLFCFLPEDQDKKFDQFQIKSLRAVSDMVIRNGGKTFENLNEVSNFLNSRQQMYDINENEYLDREW